MIYTPTELKLFQEQQEVEEHLDENFEQRIGPEGGSISLPWEWNKDQINYAISILRRYNWDAKFNVVVNPKVDNFSEIKVLKLTPMITITAEEKFIMETSKTAIMSEVVNPDAEKMKVYLYKKDEESYPNLDFEEENKIG